MADAMPKIATAVSSSAATKKTIYIRARISRQAAGEPSCVARRSKRQRPPFACAKSTNRQEMQTPKTAQAQATKEAVDSLNGGRYRNKVAVTIGHELDDLIIRSAIFDHRIGAAAQILR